jgi:hypothetical protein
VVALFVILELFTNLVLETYLYAGAPQAVSDGGVEPASRAPVVVLGCPARSEADEVALRMLAVLLDKTLFTLEVASNRLLTSEAVSLVKTRACTAVCIAALPPGGLTNAKFLCKRLRAELPELKILVARWGPPGLGGEGAETLRGAGADAVSGTLLESRDQLYQMAPLLSRGSMDGDGARTDGGAGSRTSRPAEPSTPDPSSARR